MAEADGHDLTDLLRAWAAGDGQALEKLTPHVYGELHRLARLYMAGERPNHPLQTTALINEAYIRLIRWEDVHWQSRTHFFGVAAQLMRQILVDHARSYAAAKRGQDAPRLSLEDAAEFSREQAGEIVALDDALTSLAVVRRPSSATTPRHWRFGWYRPSRRTSP